MNFDNLIQAAEHLAGLLIVVIALTSLWALTSLMGWIVTRFERPEDGKGVETPSIPVADPDDSDAVVIAAVATMLLGAKARVIAVHPVTSSWGVQGRRDIHMSHRIR